MTEFEIIRTEIAVDAAQVEARNCRLRGRQERLVHFGRRGFALNSTVTAGCEDTTLIVDTLSRTT